MVKPAAWHSEYSQASTGGGKTYYVFCFEWARENLLGHGVCLWRPLAGGLAVVAEPLAVRDLAERGPHAEGVVLAVAAIAEKDEVLLVVALAHEAAAFVEGVATGVAHHGGLGGIKRGGRCGSVGGRGVDSSTAADVAVAVGAGTGCRGSGRGRRLLHPH